MPEATTRCSTAPSPAWSAAARPTATTSDEVDAQAPGRLRGLTLGLLLGALIVGAWRACDKTHARRRSHRSSAAAEPVQSWENEGGTPDAACD